MKTNTVQIITLPNLDVQIGNELYKFSRWGVSCLGLRGAFVTASDGSEHWVSEAYYPRLTMRAPDSLKAGEFSQPLYRQLELGLPAMSG